MRTFRRRGGKVSFKQQQQSICGIRAMVKIAMMFLLVNFVIVFWYMSQLLIKVDDSMMLPIESNNNNILNNNLTKDDFDWKLRRDRLVEIYRHQVAKDGTDSSSMTIIREFPRSRVSVVGQSITVTTHLDTSKLERFLYTVRRWGGPVSASVHIKDENQISELVQFYHKNVKHFDLTDIHLLLERSDDATIKGYPHNTLRQISLDNVETEFFLALDVDMMTLPDASRGLNALLDSNPTMAADLRNNTILVLPAFDRTANATTTSGTDDIVHRADQVLPRNKHELRKLVKQQEIQVSWKIFPPCQRSTDYSRWFQQQKESSSSSSSTSSNQYYFIDYELGYEPYVIASRSSTLNLPKYWQRLRGFGYDKVSWFIEYYFSGFQFAVLSDWFVVHLEHESTKKSKRPESAYTEFRHYLKDKFKWDDEVYQMIFSKKFHINTSKKYPGPSNIPRLVGWKEHKGSVFGRVFIEGENNNNNNLSFTDHSQFLGTAIITEGRIRPNQTVKSMSGHSYYLTGLELERRKGRKPIP